MKFEAQKSKDINVNLNACTIFALIKIFDGNSALEAVLKDIL